MLVRQLKVPAEIDRQLAVWNDVNPHDRLDLGNMTSWMTSQQEVGVFIAERDGEDLGVGWAGVDRRPSPSANVQVREPYRRSGIGSALYAAVGDWARDRGHADVEVWVGDVHPDGLAFAKGRGFVEVGRQFGLELHLRDYEPPAPEPPPGVSIVTWAERPDLIRGIFEVAAEAVPDIPGEDITNIDSFEDWLRQDMGGAGDRPEATFVAVAGDEVVGYSKFSLTSAQPTVAHHDLTGVKRAWRGRGIAGALKVRQIQWAKANGYETLRTSNEERNAPIRKLNERFGYTPAPGLTLLRGPV